MKFAARLLKHLTARPARPMPAVTPAPLLLALEPRIVYDGAVAAAGAVAHHHIDAHRNWAPHSSASALAWAHGNAAASDNAASNSNAPGQHSARHSKQPTECDSTPSPTQVVFVDPNVINYQALISGLPAGTPYVMLSPNTDGLEQIAQYLQQHPGIDAIHLVSHGVEGQVQIGATWLNSGDLSNFSAELAQIGAAMKPGGDFLIYGCDVAEGSDGQAFVQQIAAATHLNVAASTDPTGASALGGDWTLEYQVGNVTTPVIFSQASEQGYGYLLTETIEDFTHPDDNGYDSGATSSFSLDGITYTIAKTGALADNTVTQDPNLQALGDENSSDNALLFDEDGVGGISSITITMADGKPFNIQSIDIDAIANNSITFLASGQSTSVSIVSNGEFATQTVALASAHSAFADVTSITIEGGNLVPTFGHIVYSEITPPTVTTTGGATTFTAVDSTTATPVVVNSGITVADTESATLASATVQITGGYQSGQDVLSFANTSGTTFGNIQPSFNSTNGTLTLTSNSATATTAQWQAALDAVKYLDTAAAPNTSARTITFIVNDGIASSSAVMKTVDVDSPPIVTTTNGTTNYASGASATTVDSGVSVTDPSQSTQVSGTVRVTSGYDSSNDTLAFTNTSIALFGHISGSFNSSNGTLTLTSTGGTSTDAQWTNAFEAVTFSSESTSYGGRTISFVVNDGTDNSVAATKSLDVTNPDPVLTTDSGSAAFVAGDNVSSTPVAVDSGLTVTDPSSGALQAATVSVTGSFHSGEDVLAFTNTNSTTFGNIVAAYNGSTGTLTLTSTGGSATLAQWQSALDAVTYTDTAITPNTATRTIGFSVTDDNSNTSNTATRTVTLADTDQTPIVTTSSGTTSYIGGASAVTVDGSIGVSDRDNTTQASGTVSISSGFHSGDTLAFSNTSGALFGNISAVYNSGTGTLTLSSSGASATDAQWANAFTAVTFSSTSTSYGDRTISFVVNDGTDNSVAATKTLDDSNPNPVVTTDSGSAAFVAGDNVSSTPVAVDPGLTVTDPGSGALQSATVSVTGNFHSGEDVLAFTNTSGTTFGNIGAAYNGSTGTLTLTSSGGTATLAQWQSALDAVTYTDTAITPNTATRTIGFSATDDNSNTSNTATRTVTVADTDQTPIVTTTSGRTNYIGGASAVTVDGSIGVSDQDNTTQASGTVSISSGFHSGDTLAFSNTSGALFGNISAVYNSGTGTLTLSSSGASATDAQWANAFTAVTFSASTSATPGNRTISFAVNDGTDNSVAATKVVDLTAPPIVTTDSGSASFIAGDNVSSTPVAVDAGLTVTDASSAELQSATVSITGNFHSGEDVLAFTNTSGTTFGNIGAAYNASTGTLTLTSSGGTETLAQWQSALDAVTYSDTAITPNTATRTIGFSATDDNSNTSNTATRTVTVADTDQTPIVTTTSGTTNYIGGASAVTVDGSITVSDRDNTTQASGTVSISSGFHNGDTLAFLNASSTLYGNISAVYNSGTGTLTLSSSGASATDAQWANAFTAVTFSASTSATPGNRTISFAVNDGTDNSTAATKVVDLTAPPIVTTDSGSASFIAGDNVSSTPVAVDAGLTVTDASSAELQSATVSITGNFHSGEDVLAFTNTSGTTFGNIGAAYNASTGTLTLTSSGGTATLAQWQSALDAVTYTDTAITPNNTTRTVSFSATGNNSATSNTATRTVTVADTDQTPIVTTTNGTTNYIGGASAVTVDGGITVSDQDNTTQASGTVTISGGFHSGDTLAFSNASGTLYGNIEASYNAGTGTLTLSSSGASATDAQWANAFDAVTFSASTTATPGNRTISFAVNDGTDNSAAATKVVDLTALPIVTTDEGSASFVAGDNVSSTPVAIDAGVNVSDADSDTLASASVSITGNFHAGEDVLAFANTNASTFGNVEASYNASTGTLTLTSSGASATLAQWQSALEAVTYTDTAIIPNNATRTISFTVNDGIETSLTATRMVTVQDTDQTPIVTTDDGSASFVAGDNVTSTPVAVDSGANVLDGGDPTLASASVSITENFHAGEDVLAFTNDGATMGNIAGSYDASTGVLTLTSSGASATLAQWKGALDSVLYTDTAITPNNTTRTISFTVSDGIETSLAAARTVTVQDTDQTPIVTLGGGTVSYTNSSTSTPTPVDTGVEVSDRGNATLVSATIGITNGYHDGEDVLSFHNTGATMGDITGSFNSATGVMSLVSPSGAATLAQWQAALAAVTYTDAATIVTGGVRTLTFTVNDGTENSTAVTRDIDVNAGFIGAVTSPVSVDTSPALPEVTTDGEAGASTSIAIVLSGLEGPSATPDISAGPAEHTVTFSVAGQHGGVSQGLLGTTSVAAATWMPLAPIPVPFEVPIAVDRESVTPGAMFSLPLVTMTNALGEGTAQFTQDVTVTLLDGRALPDWIHYDPMTGRLIGKAPANGAHELRLLITLRDSTGHRTHSEVILDFGRGGSATPSAHPVVPHAARHAVHAGGLAAKPSLAAQFVQQQRAFHVARRSIA